MNDSIPRMDYQQYRRARCLVRACCNYDSGNCIALDDGEPCVCVQRISNSVLCRWFRAAVLPLDHELHTALLHRGGAKRCVECGVTVCSRFQSRQILRRLRETGTEAQGGGTAEKTLPPFYAFRGSGTRRNKGFLKGCQEGVGIFLFRT